MPELILLRHAKAVDLGVPNDFDRPLTDKGRDQAERIGRQLLRKGLQPDAVVASPAARAWETAVIAGRELGIPESKIAPDRAVYDAEVIQLVQVLERRGADAKRLLLVGHNPGLTDLGAYLAKSVAPDWGMAKGAAAHLRIDGTWSDLRRATAVVAAVMEP